jgi:hypothetical protein
MDYSDLALPPGMDAKKIQAGIELGLKQMTDRGWQADACLIVATWGKPPGSGPFIAMSAALRSVFPGVSPPRPPAGPIYRGLKRQMNPYLVTTSMESIV